MTEQKGLNERDDPGKIMPGGGIYLDRGERKPHYCNPPGTFRRWVDGVGIGAIWMCEERHKFKLIDSGWRVQWISWPPPSKPLPMRAPKETHG